MGVREPAARLLTHIHLHTDTTEGTTIMSMGRKERIIIAADILRMDPDDLTARLLDDGGDDQPLTASLTDSIVNDAIGYAQGELTLAAFTERTRNLLNTMLRTSVPVDPDTWGQGGAYWLTQDGAR